MAELYAELMCKLLVSGLSHAPLERHILLAYGGQMLEDGSGRDDWNNYVVYSGVKENGIRVKFVRREHTSGKS